MCHAAPWCPQLRPSFISQASASSRSWWEWCGFAFVCWRKMHTQHSLLLSNLLIRHQRAHHFHTGSTEILPHAGETNFGGAALQTPKVILSCLQLTWGSRCWRTLSAGTFSYSFSLECSEVLDLDGFINSYIYLINTIMCNYMKACGLIEESTWESGWPCATHLHPLALQPQLSVKNACENSVAKRCIKKQKH